MKIIKQKANKLASSLLALTENWDSSGKLKVLIKCWKGFEEEVWINTDGFNEISELVALKFVHSKIELLKNIKKANIIFSDSWEDAFLTKNIKFVQVPLTGLDYYRENELNRLNIVTSRGLSSRLIAEYVLAFILYSIKCIDAVLKNQNRMDWNQDVFFKNLMSLEQIRVAILGYGAVGKEIAGILNNFGSQLFVIDKIFNNDRQSSGKISFFTDIEDFYKEVDYFIISIPLLKENIKLIKRELLKKLGENCTLINISRGEIIDEFDLIWALENRIIKRAVIDVTIEEPLPENSPLWNCPNLLITPHIAGNINFIKEKIVKRFLFNIKAIINNNELEGLYK